MGEDGGRLELLGGPSISHQLFVDALLFFAVGYGGTCGSDQGMFG